MFKQDDTPIGKLIDFCTTLGSRLDPIGFGPGLTPADRHRQAGEIVDEYLTLHDAASVAFANAPAAGYVLDRLTRLRTSVSAWAQITAEPYDPAEDNTPDAKTSRWVGAMWDSKDAWLALDSLCGVRPGQTAAKRPTRGTIGAEKWRMAQNRMIDLLKSGELPSTVRRASRLLAADGFKFSTVRTAAIRSDLLKAHFGLSANAQLVTGEPLLDELTAQANERNQQAMARMSPEQRREAEDALRQMNPAQRADFVSLMATDSDAGRARHASFIENADQGTRDDDDWSG